MFQVIAGGQSRGAARRPTPNDKDVTELDVYNTLHAEWKQILEKGSRRHEKGFTAEAQRTRRAEKVDARMDI